MFVLAIDADARSMAETSRRAAGRPARGGLPNIVFLAEGVERIPSAFDGLADVVTVLFPWGSLLRGALGRDTAIAASIARLVAPGGRLDLVVSLVERDRAAIGGEGPLGDTDIAEMTRTYAALDLVITEARCLSPDEIRATGSTWARRLASGADRPVWQIRSRAEIAVNASALRYVR